MRTVVKATSESRVSKKNSSPFHYQDLISYSPYCLPHNSYDVSSENLVLDQLMILFSFPSFDCLILSWCFVDFKWVKDVMGID